MLLYTFTVLSHIFIGYFSPQESLYGKYPKLLCLMYSGLFSKICGFLQLNSLCNLEYNQNKFEICFFIISLPLITSLYLLGLINLFLLNFISLLFLVMTNVLYFDFFNKTTKDLAKILNLERFALKN